MMAKLSAQDAGKADRIYHELAGRNFDDPRISSAVAQLRQTLSDVLREHEIACLQEQRDELDTRLHELQQKGIGQ